MRWEEVIYVVTYNQHDIKVFVINLFILIGIVTVQWVKDHWKYLRDAYMKARKKIKSYIPSGSSAASAKRARQTSFRFYERMTFLETTLRTEA